MSGLNWQPGMTLEALEEMVITKAFRIYGGNYQMTANALGIEVHELEEKIQKYAALRKEQEKMSHEYRRKQEDLLRRQRGSYAPNPEASEGEAHAPQANTGLSVESTPEASSQYTMPVQKRPEVQGMLSRPHSQGRHRRHR